jgi:hypothetical protein
MAQRKRNPDEQKKRADDLLWRAEKDAKIFLIKEKYKGPDGSVDTTAGTPGHQEYRDWLKSKAKPQDWDAQASRDLDEYTEARAPIIDPIAPRLPQLDAELRLDDRRRITVIEGEARQSHWTQHRDMLIAVRKRIVAPMDKEIIYSDFMISKFRSERETTKDVLRREEEGSDAGHAEAAD